MIPAPGGTSGRKKTTPMLDLKVRPLEELIEASSATPAFKAAVAELAAQRPQDRITWNRTSPPVKVLRLVTKMLEEFPALPFDSLEVDGDSGCSDFTGTAIADPGHMKFEFVWDCKWMAEMQGWSDPFGDPDQIRAARTLGYQCFKKLEKVSG